MQPNPKSKAVYHENLLMLRVIEQRLREAQDRGKPSGETYYVPRYIQHASPTSDSRFGLQLLRASSSMSQREDSHHVEERSNDCTEHGWEDLPPRRRRNRRYGTWCAQFLSAFEESPDETEEEDKSPE